MKRFYETVHYDCQDTVYYFYLDNKIIKTPMGHLLSTPLLAKANAITKEWQAQTDNIIPNTMPITKYLNTVHDKIIPNHAYIITQLLDYADNDCIFYFTEKTDSDLYQRQHQYWLPIIQHFATYYTVKLNYSSHLILNSQCDDFKNHLQDFFKSLSYENLAGLYSLITIFGSVLLGLYAYNGHISYQTAFKYSRLEESFNIKNWGLDLEIEKKHVFINQEITQAILFLELT